MVAKARTRTVAAVESWYGPATVAVAKPLRDGRVHVTTRDFPDAASAAAYAFKSAPTVLAGKSLCADPLFADAEPMVSTTRRAYGEYVRLITQGRLVYEGSGTLVGHVKVIVWAASRLRP